MTFHTPTYFFIKYNNHKDLPEFETKSEKKEYLLQRWKKLDKREQNIFIDLSNKSSAYYNKEKKVKKNKEEISCSICYENEWLTKTPCGHDICVSCLCQIRKPECPICRFDLKNSIPKVLKPRTQIDILRNRITNRQATNQRNSVTFRNRIHSNINLQNLDLNLLYAIELSLLN